MFLLSYSRYLTSGIEYASMVIMLYVVMLYVVMLCVVISVKYSGTGETPLHPSCGEMIPMFVTVDILHMLIWHVCTVYILHILIYGMFVTVDILHLASSMVRYSDNTSCTLYITDPRTNAQIGARKPASTRIRSQWAHFLLWYELANWPIY